MVSGGIRDYVAQGNVVVLVDPDNIDAGDPRVVLDETWRPLTLGVFDQAESKYVTFGKGSTEAIGAAVADPRHAILRRTEARSASRNL